MDRFRRVIASTKKGITAKGAHDRRRNVNEERKSVSHDGIDRRGFLDWMAWAGTGLLWTFSGGARPVVVFAHIPLWSVYPEWGRGTEDSGQALGYLKRFGSVTVLNGHIHQVMQKTEGNVMFHTAMSTAFPQAASVRQFASARRGTAR